MEEKGGGNGVDEGLQRGDLKVILALRSWRASKRTRAAGTNGNQPEVC